MFMVNTAKVIHMPLNVCSKNSPESINSPLLFAWTDLDIWGRPLTVCTPGVVMRGWHTSQQVIFSMPTCIPAPVPTCAATTSDPHHAQPHQATSRLNHQPGSQSKYKDLNIQYTGYMLGNE